MSVTRRNEPQCVSRRAVRADDRNIPRTAPLYPAALIRY
jgi:hypothetical protein